MTQRLLTTQELAKDLGLSVRTILRYVKDGKIPFYGTTPYRFDRGEVLDALRGQGRQP